MPSYQPQDKEMDRQIVEICRKAQGSQGPPRSYVLKKLGF